MIPIRLTTRDGRHVADVLIPPFQALPEVVVWGERFFSLHSEFQQEEDPAAAEYREVFCFWIPPAFMTDANR